MQQLIRNFHFFLLRQKGITIICGALVLTGILWWFDYVSGYETTFSSFYLIPIALTVVYVNMGAVFSITALCLAVWVISNQWAGEVYASEAVGLWNTFMHLITGGYLLHYIAQSIKNAAEN